eukprot:TRINITY_DN8322_c0_g2_i1.p1 TRINITY_DN8322_c0_g2~~TRINITY_DN8322_c0_g2_i1.p1  ORF type:complete len:153 (+),score=13.66 TRINITY_DN8322_c0_g2_i1:82-540(+)
MPGFVPVVLGNLIGETNADRVGREVSPLTKVEVARVTGGLRGINRNIAATRAAVVNVNHMKAGAATVTHHAAPLAASTDSISARVALAQTKVSAAKGAYYLRSVQRRATEKAITAHTHRDIRKAVQDAHYSLEVANGLPGARHHHHHHRHSR